MSVVQAGPGLPASFRVGARNFARWGNYWTVDLRLSRSVAIADGELAQVTTIDTLRMFFRRQLVPGGAPAV